jgi:hypothetical protein
MSRAFDEKFLRDALGYADVRATAPRQVGERSFQITLQAAPNIPVVVARAALDLDDPDPAFAPALVHSSGGTRKKAEVAARLSAGAARGDDVRVLAGSLEPGLRARIQDMVANRTANPRVATWSARDAIVLILLLHWFCRSGPLTTQYLM